MTPSQMTPEQREFIAELTRVITDKTEAILKTQTEIVSHLAKINGSIKHLQEWREDQVEWDEKVLSCTTDLATRLAVLERIAALQDSTAEKRLEQLKYEIERDSEKQERRHEWTVGQIIALAVGGAGGGAILSQLVSLLTK